MNVGNVAEGRGLLVIGYGNTMRRDDGVGVRAAELLAHDPRVSDARILARYQLVPELALDIGGSSLVVFIDADMRGLPGSIDIQPIEAGQPRPEADGAAGRGAFSHHVGPGELMALAAELSGSRPAAVAIGIGVADADAGEGLTPAVEASLPRVADVVADLVAQRRSGP